MSFVCVRVRVYDHDASFRGRCRGFSQFFFSLLVGRCRCLFDRRYPLLKSGQVPCLVDVSVSLFPLRRCS